MNKSINHSFEGLVKDISTDRFSNKIYFDGRNIRIFATNTQSTSSITNEKGNGLLLTIPNPTITDSIKEIQYEENEIVKILNYTTNEINDSYDTSENQIIIGHCFIRDNIIIFSTNDLGIDCIWMVNDTTYEITLLYLRNLNFSTSHPIQALSNYENESIDKIYWVDGINQMRFINVHHSIANQDLEELIDLSMNSLQQVGTFDLDQPEIIDTIQGGLHTSGMIQYAYNLYRINGTQTKISPLTELIPLDKGEDNGGGAINEIVGTIPIIKIDELDENYTNLRLYAIKYTSYNQLPQISLILDRSIVGITEVIYYDDANIIEDLSLEEFLFLGSDLIIPKHINTKFNYMFFANYKEKNFDVDTYGEPISIDTRAFSFAPNTIITNIYNSLYDNSGTIDSLEPSFIIDTSVIGGVTQVPYRHSAINIDYDSFNRQYNSTNVGGEGAYLKYKIVRKQIGIDGFTSKDAEGRFLKDNEIYRLGIEFYNKYGQNSLPKWIADFKNIVLGNQSNLNGYYATLEIDLKPLFYSWLANDNNFLDENGNFDDSLKPVGYRLLRVDRTLLDRTIVCQGLLNGMLAQIVGDQTGDNDYSDKIERVNTLGLKIPSMMRRFDDYLCPMWHNETYFRVDRFDETHPNFDNSDGVLQDAANEVFKATEEDQWSAGTYQFNKLMQMFSPEIMFNIIQNVSQTNLTVIGGLENDYNAAWEQVRNTANKLIEHEGKSYNCIYPHDVKAYDPGNFDLINGDRDNLQFHGFFSHNNEGRMNFVQTYRKYTGEYYSADEEYTPYGVPDIVETGQGRSTYNNDSDLIYYNSLEIMAADLVLNSVNTWGARNITFALGDSSLDTEDRPGIEDLFDDSNIIDTGAGLIGEFRIPRNLVYLGNIYGGNTYESKKRSNYIEIGNYNNIDIDSYLCLHSGDTYVNSFRFTKLVKTETEVYSTSSEQLTEIVEFRVETTVDLLNRNDQSLQDWDNRFQPQYIDYQKYNTVYSQEPTLIIRKDLDYKFKRVNSFDTNVISSKVKVPGEVIDSWTDLQVNNVLTLNGRYGPINCLHNYKEELYTLQDSGVAFLSILPRVQVAGNDGIEVELGSGNVLQQYKYITTESGTKNKWSVVNSPQAFYYFDLLNKCINSFNDKLQGISDGKGLHTYFQNNINYDLVNIDNPILSSGVSTGYDYINDDVFFTFLQDNLTFTLSYNEKAFQGEGGFVSFWDFFPSRYISRGTNFITPDPTNTILYQHYIGEYNNYYGVYYPSYIILNVNPEPNAKDCIFDNINYKSDVFLDGVDQPTITLTDIQAYNEYQDSSLVPIIVGRNKNARRKFRDWNILIPRDGRNRIRNPYIKLKLQFDNENNYQLILHSVNIYYTVEN